MNIQKPYLVFECYKIVFQTLTGKEIEIDIEPTDKVKLDLNPRDNGMCEIPSIKSKCLHVHKGGAD